MPARVSSVRREMYRVQRYDKGMNRSFSAKAAGVSRSWAEDFDKEWRANIAAVEKMEHGEGGPIPLDELCDEASRSLADIGFFAHRYFGLMLMPWQEEATEIITRLQGTEEEEYVVINVAPGTGKSTFFTLVLPSWITARQRHIRGMIGSAGMGLAKTYTGELRSVLQSTEPLRQPPERVRAQVAVQPEGCLVTDFGPFKGDGRWASDALAVQQHDGALYRSKEYTWQAFGRGTTFIGTRVDFCVWDDVYDPEDNRTVDAREQLKRWWKDIAEARLEPGGLMVLQGQRIDSDDIYRFALDQKHVEFDAAGEEVAERPKYHHIVYKAHDESKCQGEVNHHRSSPPWPQGCLLFPRRLTWAKLAAEKRNNPNFETLYQQEDADPRQVLVQKVWVTGGQDHEGNLFPGCWDYERGGCELPKGIEGPLVSVCTVDPSPTRYWACQWWIVQPSTGLRYLMDLYKGKMQSTEFLDVLEGGEYIGIAAQWQKRSEDLGWPITHWIVEQNAAARFMLQVNHVKKWASKHRVQIIGHETHRNKADAELGVQSIGSHYRYGLIRLPGHPTKPGRTLALRLVDEVTRYPGGATDDQVMAHWFLEWNLSRIVAPDLSKLPRGNRPKWLKDAEKVAV